MIIGVGPFVGSFEYEILSFRPYAKWLGSVLEYDQLYVSSHRDSQFLYSEIQAENYIPLYFNASDQTGLVHKNVNHKRYLKLIREFKSKVFHINNVAREDILIYTIPYTKFTDPIMIFKKEFRSITVSQNEKYKNKVFFGNCREIADIVDKDRLFSFALDYTVETNKQDLVERVSSCAALFCPVGFLTILGNLQKCKVLSWGVDNLGKYRRGGIYNFGNPNSKIMYYKNTDQDDIVRTINNYIAGVL